jgi:hypothetical protein
MTPKVITISLLMLAGCSKPEAKTVADKTPESQPIEATPDSAPIDTPPTNPPSNVIALSELPNYVGKEVTLRGQISDLPWQHLMSPPAGTKYDYYFNIDKSQIVLYTVEEFSCGTTLEVKGTVLEVAGATKRSSKASDPLYKEYHLSVSSWKCLP